MADTTLILIDDKEKRITSIHYTHLTNGILRALAKNPGTIAEFNQHYQTLTGESFYRESNRPRVPQDITVDEIRRTMGLDARKSAEEVIEYWKERTPQFQPQNYHSYKPNEQVEEDIPELKPSLLESLLEEDNSVTQKEWAQIPESVQRKIRRRVAPCNDGIVVVDLRSKTIRYLSNHVFDIKKKDENYSLPDAWKIVEE